MVDVPLLLDYRKVSPVNIYIYIQYIFLYHCISRCIFYSSIRFLIYLLSHIFIYLLLYLFIYSFVYIFISSFIHSFICASLLIFKLFIYSIIFHLPITSSKKCFWERSLSTNLYLPTIQCQCQAITAAKLQAWLRYESCLRARRDFHRQAWAGFCIN